MRQKKPIIVNDFHAPNPLKKGYPEGHVPLSKYLTIPVISDGRIVAVVGVANKEIDYTDSDVRQLTLLMDNVWQITERQRAENELRKLSRAVEQSPASIVITDTSGAIEYVNPKFVQITGYSFEEAIGKNPRILKSGEKSAEEYKQLWDTITSGSEWRGEFHNKKKNGELYWEAAVISPITDVKGVITHFLAVKEDITERKQAEEKLYFSETRYRRLFESAKDGILILDADSGQIVDVNPFLIEMLGYTYEEFLGNHLWEIGVFKNIAASKNAFTELQDKGYIRFEDMPLEKKDGTPLDVEFVSNVYFVNQTKVIQCNIRDITERKQAEAERERLIGELKAALADVKTLSGLIPICSSCKKIRDDQGYWQQVESYIQRHSDAKFTHGICPDCMIKLYPEYEKDKQKVLNNRM